MMIETLTWPAKLRGSEYIRRLNENEKGEKPNVINEKSHLSCINYVLINGMHDHIHSHWTDHCAIRVDNIMISCFSFWLISDKLFMLMTNCLFQVFLDTNLAFKQMIQLKKKKKFSLRVMLFTISLATCY